jgi:RNA polymerase sigma-70 factor (ECF subfamily)
MEQFETLYRQHAPAILRFAWGLCGDRSQAEDIVSETFVRVLTKKPRIETRTALAYLLTIARNVHLSGWRRRKREVSFPDDLPAPDRDPLHRLENQARLEATLRALEGLAEGERAALLLRADQNLPYEEIAAALGITPVAAKVRVHRARLHLLNALESQGVDHEVRSDT